MTLSSLPRFHAAEAEEASSIACSRSPARGEATWRPAFLADWTGVTMVHLAVPPALLQRAVPFPLDLYQDEACVSLVAFTMEHMRPAWLDSHLGEWLLRPIAPCRFLNVRTYVQAGSQPGIYFLGEWLSRWANIPLGPLTYGLPYRAGRLDFERSVEGRRSAVAVRSLTGDRLAFTAQADAGALEEGAPPDSWAAFLLERYYAFTRIARRSFAFQVEHQPWRQTPARIQLNQADLLARTGGWWQGARLLGGHLSPGVRGVEMSIPRRIDEPRRNSRSAFVL